MLADPYSLGDVVPAWQPPEVPPETSRLRAAALELELGLQPATPGHMQWCVNKLFVLPTRDVSTVTAAFAADNFIDACGHFPDDLWSAGTIELLQSKTFRPSPAELVAAIGPKYRERQRMLERVKIMLGGRASEDPNKPFEPEPLESRLRQLRDSLRKIGQHGRAAPYERGLAKMENRAPEDWSLASHGVEKRDMAAREPSPPLSPGMQQRTLRSLAKAYRAKGHVTQAERLETEADAIVVPDEALNAYKGGMPAYERELDTSEHYRDIPEGNAA